MKPGRLLAAVFLSAASGAVLTFFLFQPKPPPPTPETVVIERVRAVARLEALEVVLYRKVSFSPDPAPQESLWGDVWSWARHTLRQPQGRAIVFAKAHLAYDLRKVQTGQLRVSGPKAELQLPPLEVSVELLPGETEVIGSNLDSAETAQLLQLAKAAFEREVAQDTALQARARASAENTLRALLFELGFRPVVVVAPPS